MRFSFIITLIFFLTIVMMITVIICNSRGHVKISVIIAKVWVILNVLFILTGLLLQYLRN